MAIELEVLSERYAHTIRSKRCVNEIAFPTVCLTK